MVLQLFLQLNFRNFNNIIHGCSVVNSIVATPTPNPGFLYVLIFTYNKGMAIVLQSYRYTWYSHRTREKTEMELTTAEYHEIFPLIKL